jgi:hypothetical protein
MNNSSAGSLWHATPIEMMILQPLLPKIDAMPETRRSTPATVPIRGGGASAASAGTADCLDVEEQKTILQKIHRSNLSIQARYAIRNPKAPLLCGFE